MTAAVVERNVPPPAGFEWADGQPYIGTTYCDGEFIAEWPEAKLFAVDREGSMAVAGLRAEIASFYDDAEQAQREGTIGGVFAEQWDVVSARVRRRGGNA